MREMGRWGDGEMGKWGDGEMVKKILLYPPHPPHPPLLLPEFSWRMTMQTCENTLDDF